MKPSISSSLCTPLVLVATLAHAELSFVDLKGTHALFPEEKSYLLPIHGCAWWNSNILPNLYDYGDEHDATVQLIKELFHKPVDSLQPTKFTQKIAAFFVPGTIGAIMRALEAPDLDEGTLTAAIISAPIMEEGQLLSIAERKTRIHTLERHVARLEKLKGCLSGNTKICEAIIGGAESRTAAEGNNKKLVMCTFGLQGSLEKKEKLTKQPEGRRGGLKKHVATMESLLAKIPRDIQLAAVEQHAELVAQRATTVRQIGEIRREITREHASFKALERQARKLAKLILDAYNESREPTVFLGYGRTRPATGAMAPGRATPHRATLTPKYAPYTLHNIFLAFLWVKAKSPADLNAYAHQTGLQRASLRSVPYDPAVDLEEARMVLRGAGLVRHISNQQFEQLIFAIMAEAPLPLASYVMDATYNGITFSDCTETTVRNLFNVILYNKNTRNFGAKKLEEIFGKDVDEQLVRYYEAPISAPTFVVTPEARNAWTAVVSGRRLPIEYRKNGIAELAAPMKNVEALLEQLVGKPLEAFFEKLNIEPEIKEVTWGPFGDGHEITFEIDGNEYVMHLTDGHAALERGSTGSNDISDLQQLIKEKVHIKTATAAPAQNNIAANSVGLALHTFDQLRRQFNGCTGADSYNPIAQNSLFGTLYLRQLVLSELGPLVWSGGEDPCAEEFQEALKNLAKHRFAPSEAQPEPTGPERRLSLLTEAMLRNLFIKAIRIPQKVILIGELTGAIKTPNNEQELFIRDLARDIRPGTDDKEMLDSIFAHHAKQKTTWSDLAQEMMTKAHVSD